MKSVKEAQDTILAKITRQPKEAVSVTETLGRVLAEDVRSNRNHPPYDVSAMDGYAVRHEDIKDATREKPVKLDIIDDIKAGSRPAAAVAPGTASRIMTGAPVPVGSDTVIRVEDTDSDDIRVKIFVPAKKGSDIRRLGENLKTDDMVLQEGTEITPAGVGILAMVKKKTVAVYKRPAVAILSTGDELEGLDEPFDPEKIPDANTYTIMAQVKSAGAEPVILGIARDTHDAIERKIKDGLACDALIISGGVAVGHHDFVRPALKSLGIEMHFWRVSIRPGHPFAFGTNGGKPVFALPGNPVSSMVCFEQFILPALKKMMGAQKLFRLTLKAKLKGDIRDKKGRTNFMRAGLENTSEGFVTHIAGAQGSGILMSMVNADGLLVVPSDADMLKEGEMVTVQMLTDNFLQKKSCLPE